MNQDHISNTASRHVQTCGCSFSSAPAASISTGCCNSTVTMGAFRNAECHVLCLMPLTSIELSAPLPSGRVTGQKPRMKKMWSLRNSKIKKNGYWICYYLVPSTTKFPLLVQPSNCLDIFTSFLSHCWSPNSPFIHGDLTSSNGQVQCSDTSNSHMRRAAIIQK